MKYDGAFWKATMERALSTFVQAYLGLWLAGDVVLDVFTFDFATGLGPALGAALLSVVKGMIAANVGTAGPSFANEVVLHEDAPRGGVR
jgi:r1t holin